MTSLKEYLKLSGLLAIFFFFFGCATIINGTTQKITVKSLPTSATVKVNGTGTAYTTPCEIELKRSHECSLEIGKTGFETTSVKIKKTISLVVVGNLLLMGSVAWAAVDVLTGATFQLKPDKIEVALKPNGTHPDSFQEAYDPKSHTDQPTTTLSSTEPETEKVVSKKYF
jgi:hypothetical protein